MEKQSFDIIVVGSGIAGLSFAIETAKLRPESKILIITKAGFQESNSNFAQGGIASVFNFAEDSFESHFQDTMKSGSGLSDPKVVKHVVTTGPSRVLELENFGISFNRNPLKKLHLALEGGHSNPRVVHQNDSTGKSVVEGLFNAIKKYSNVLCIENKYCIELIKDETGKVNGVLTADSNSLVVECFTSKFVILATGGCGQIFRYTTNPIGATGDGVFLAHKAGAKLSNMQFIQFHPTALVEEDKQQFFLISEAVRGAGAYIVNNKGERFVFDYDERGELATRDIVSKAIFSELKNSWCDTVFLDLRHLKLATIKKDFPTIYSYLVSIGINCAKSLIPIVPAAHYQCGGIKVDFFGRTNIEGLLAIGECSETGLHGSNRLASNSLLEALVYAHEAAKFVSVEIDYFEIEDVLVIPPIFNGNADNTCKDYIEMVKDIMSNYVTIFSVHDDLIQAKIFIEEIRQLFEIHVKEEDISFSMLDIRSIISIAELIIEAHLNEWEEKKIELKKDKNILI